LWPFASCALAAAWPYKPIKEIPIHLLQITAINCMGVLRPEVRNFNALREMADKVKHLANITACLLSKNRFI